jgi:four helix bundle protein
MGEKARMGEKWDAVHESGNVASGRSAEFQHGNPRATERLAALPPTRTCCVCSYRYLAPDERYGLSTQAHRAAHSAAANIAKGWARHGTRELRRYLSITRGSLAELSYTLRLAFDCGILPETAFHNLQNLRDAAEATTWKLFKAVSRKDRPVV